MKRILLLTALVLLSLQVAFAATPAVVSGQYLQTSLAGGQASSATVSGTFASNVTVGNWIIAGVMYCTTNNCEGTSGATPANSDHVTSISGSGVTTWLSCAVPTTIGAGSTYVALHVEIWYGKVTSAVNTGITVNYSDSWYNQVYEVEVTNLDNSPCDQHQDSYATNLISPPPMTVTTPGATAVANEFVYAMGVSFQTGPLLPDSPYTGVQSSTFTADEYKVAGGTGTETATMTPQGGGTFSNALSIATFKQSTGGGATRNSSLSLLGVQ